MITQQGQSQRMALPFHFARIKPKCNSFDEQDTKAYIILID